MSPSDRRPGDQSFGLEDTQVVGEQVRRHRQHRRQLGRGGVADGEGVDDAQPRRIGEGRVQGRPPLKLRHSLSVHCLNLD